MPSGSHGGGGGGSHRGGGASFGGGGGSRGGSSRHGSGYHRSTIIMWGWGGRRYHLNTKWSNTVRSLSFLLVFSVIFMGLGLIQLMNGNSFIKQIKVDYYYYQDMIERALPENNADYMSYRRTATIIDHYYNEDCEKWWFKYSFELDNGDMQTGWTYSLYTREQLNQPEYQIDATITIAVASKNVTANTDSVPMDYYQMPLERDGEYVKAQSQKQLGIILLSTAGAVFVLIVAGQAIIMAKYKESGQPKDDTTSVRSPYSR